MPELAQEWEQANKLNSVPKLTPKGGTNTGAALISALDYVARRITYYDKYPKQPIPKAIPHIFHFTDGAPTDVQMGDTMWLAVQELLKQEWPPGVRLELRKAHGVKLTGETSRCCAFTVRVGSIGFPREDR